MSTILKQKSLKKNFVLSVYLILQNHMLEKVLKLKQFYWERLSIIDCTAQIQFTRPGSEFTPSIQFFVCIELSGVKSRKARKTVLT